MAFVLMIPREARMRLALAQIRAVVAMPVFQASLRKRRSLPLVLFLRLAALFSDLYLAVDTQNFPILALTLRRAFQIVAHLVRLDFLLPRSLHTVP